MFGPEIEAASTFSGIPAAFLAGFVGVECGKDKKGGLKPSATRFEPHVYTALLALRDGAKSRYQGLSRSHVVGKTEPEMRALAHSYGPTQIMGWHTLKNLPDFTIADLNRGGRRFVATVELMRLNSAADLKARAWPRVLRTWNTGRPDGKTYHADYVPNALAVMEAYSTLPALAAPKPAEPSPAAPDPLPAELPEIPTPASPPDPAPEPDLIGSLERYGDKFEKVDKVANRVSGASWIVTLGAKGAGVALVVWEILKENRDTFLLIAGVALVVAGIWYFSRAKDRSNARALNRE